MAVLNRMTIHKRILVIDSRSGLVPPATNTHPKHSLPHGAYGNVRVGALLIGFYKTIF